MGTFSIRCQTHRGGAGSRFAIALVQHQRPLCLAEPTGTYSFPSTRLCPSFWSLDALKRVRLVVVLAGAVLAQSWRRPPPTQLATAC